MINVHSLNKVFRHCGKETAILSDVKLRIRKGECVMIGGPSGSGKTTLLNIMGCLTRPSSGEVFVHGKRISHLPDHFLCELRRAKIGFVFQQFNLLRGYTALENVAMPLVPAGVNRIERLERAASLLDQLGLKDMAGYHVNKLSGGEQQRVAIARALVNDPELIIADEPVSNVDSQNAAKITEIFNRLIREGKTVIMTTHNGSLADKLPVTAAYRLSGGRLL